MITFVQAVSEDLLQLCTLHDRELDSELIAALWEVDFPRSLGLVIKDENTLEVSDRLATCIRSFKSSADEETLNRLAADYADIYLNYALRVSPMESVWLDDDSLTHQQPMFNVRAFYRRYGLAAENWRIKSEDHLVLQLQFLSHLASLAVEESHRKTEILADMAEFMDTHLLLWIDDFAVTVCARCSTEFYAALAAFTAAYLNELRDRLVEIASKPRLSEEQISAILGKSPQEQEMVSAGISGDAPGW